MAGGLIRPSCIPLRTPMRSIPNPHLLLSFILSRLLQVLEAVRSWCHSLGSPSLLSPRVSIGFYILRLLHLLLLALALEVLPGTERQRSADQNNSIKTDTSRSAVGRRGGRTGLRVGLGLWIAGLFKRQLIHLNLYYACECKRVRFLGGTVPRDSRNPRI